MERLQLYTSEDIVIFKPLYTHPSLGMLLSFFQAHFGVPLVAALKKGFAKQN